MESKEEILKKMLDCIDNKYDKTPGGFFFDILKANAIEYENLYKKAEEIYNKCFLDTTYGEYLDRKVSEQGLTRKQATFATTTVDIEGFPGSNINIGDIVASDNVNFICLENKIISDNKKIQMPVKCSEAGSIGNVPKGAIRYFPVTIQGLISVTNNNSVTNGFDIENDTDLKQRYYDKVRTPATSGNKQHYINWSKEVVGVLDSKIFPLWNGPGTIKIVILDSNKKGANKELINNVSNYIEEKRPIGASVSIFPATEKTLNISVKLNIDEKNYSIENIKTQVKQNIENYLEVIAFKTNFLSINKIGSLIFSVPGVLDYNNLKINNSIDNINIKDEEVAVLGGVNFE